MACPPKFQRNLGGLEKSWLRIVNNVRTKIMEAGKVCIPDLVSIG